MKILSIKEPFATLIKKKKKYIETRSWKTNYRDQLYIHASIYKIRKDFKEIKEIMNLVNDDKTGCVIMMINKNIYLLN